MQVNISLGNTHPCVLVCLPTGHVALVKSPHFRETFDHSGDVLVDFLDDSFTVYDGQDEAEFPYAVGINYRPHPLLKRWLIQQNLQNPFKEPNDI